MDILCRQTSQLPVHDDVNDCDDDNKDNEYDHCADADDDDNQLCTRKHHHVSIYKPRYALFTSTSG